MPDGRGFHTVIVGGGTAGCVLANRLSARRDRSVALIEAGPDFGPADGADWPPELASAAFVPTSYEWGDLADAAGYSIPYARGKVIGGSSAINAAGIKWGLRQDYDRWEAEGNTGWGFDALLPCFQRVERLEDDDPPLRGRAGMLVVQRMRSDSPFLADLGRSFAAAGLEAVRDVSGPDTFEGFGAPTRNARAGKRFHAAAAYLDPVRDRPNLTILDRTLVDSVRWERGRALGLHLVSGADRWFVEAERIVLSAGAIGSPLILQRSGIGPPDLLRGVLGNQVDLHPLPGVGSNLQDHFGARTFFRVAADFYDRLGQAGPATNILVHARLKSSADLPTFDLDVLTGHMTVRPTVADLARVTCIVNHIQPEARGSVAIRSADPAAPPVIETGFGGSQDVEAIARGLEWVRDRMHDDRVASWLDGEVAPGAEAQGAALRDWVRASLASYHHPVGTCRFGPSADPLAVVDGRGLVHGFDNLYVADASIMPTVPHTQINLTVYAIGEKIGEGLAES